ncbi:MAG: hypothetical protein DRP89_01170 [Candidatus Neomarinimicrobiota bacterium]|nr:MAG: hypothetical protein DRP89_01170 [Candidatus Neomarinimicrobiota bacterium]
MVKKIYISSLILFLFYVSCFKEKPTQYDGALSIKLFVEFEGKLLTSIPVSLKTYDYNVATFTDTTDSSGMVIFEDLPWAYYRVNVKSEVIVPSPVDTTLMDTLLVIYTDYIEIGNENTIIDTLHAIASGAEPGLKINELYTVGPVNGGSIHYFSDQFFELYNSSDDTVYLDGMIFCRIYHMLDWISSIFQFPGEPLMGREYPVPPDSFVVVALDAYDHRTVIPESIDLSNADWEFRNSMDYADFDNPDVPNLDNLEVGCHLDFGIGLTMDVILIADGSDTDYPGGIDIETVIDCVEYASFAHHIKDIEPELDRGFGGVGLSKYSGLSLERIAPGFDTNNSTLDFEIIPHPTPGYQHE